MARTNLIRLGVAWLAFGAAALLLAGAAEAQGARFIGGRLTIERKTVPQSGLYAAGDSLRFVFDRGSDHALMRFEGDPEIYYLRNTPASLGGRAFIMDTGEIMLQVSSWGGITVYTLEAPQGLPAERIGDANELAVEAVSFGAIADDAQDLTQRFRYVRGLDVAFEAEPGAFDAQGRLRKIAYDAQQNAARALDRIAATSAGRKAIAQRIARVRIVDARTPDTRMEGSTLVVGVAAGRGVAGRLSSRALELRLRGYLAAGAGSS